MLAEDPHCECHALAPAHALAPGARPISYGPPVPAPRPIEDELATDGPAHDGAGEDREMSVLRELSRGGADERTAFQGLRRRLGLHQQALTRTLRRLERQGVVERDDRGYALTTQGQAHVRSKTASTQLAPAKRAPPAAMVPVLQALLPPTVTAEHVADRLARRWFRDLRWYGRADAPREVTLSWLTLETGSLVRVRFARGMVVLEVELARDETLDRFPAAQALLKAVAELYAPGDGAHAA